MPELTGTARFRALGELAVALADELENRARDNPEGVDLQNIGQRVWNIGASVMNECDQQEAADQPVPANLEGYKAFRDGVCKALGVAPSWSMAVVDAVKAARATAAASIMRDAVAPPKALLVVGAPTSPRGTLLVAIMAGGTKLGSAEQIVKAFEDEVKNGRG